MSTYKIPHVLVIGDLMMDRYLEGNSDRVSQEAPVVIVDVQHERAVLGGAANVAANLISLDACVDLIGVVGQDTNAQAMLALLKQQNIESYLVEDISRPTTVKTRIIAMHKQVMRYDQESREPINTVVVSALLEKVKACLPRADVVILSDYAKGVLHHQVCAAVISLAKQANKPVLVDPKGLDFSKYRGASLIKPNRKELELATGGQKAPHREDLVTRAQQLMQDTDIETILLTLSEDGMLILQQQHPMHHIHTQAREVFDVTGAGDTVLATLAYGLAQGHDLLGSAALANTAAAVVVSKMGSATVTHREIVDFQIRHHQLTGSKVCELPQLLAKLDTLSHAGKQIVFTNGCFDLLHAGHVQYLNAARALGDVLVVGLNSDDSVRRLKGSTRPVNTAPDRAAVLAGLQAVDFVVEFSEDTPLQLIKTILPNFLVKGSDYHVDQIVGAVDVIAAGGQVKTIDFLEGRSSSAMIRRIEAHDC